MHGELDIVYDTLRKLEEAEGVKIDLLLCCGDFQVCSASLSFVKLFLGVPFELRFVRLVGKWEKQLPHL
jgi:hypothetical protein